MVAAIGTGGRILQRPRLRRLLGLVPSRSRRGDRTILRQKSRGGGNRYLRVLFVQAAWVVLVRIKNWERYGLKSWIEAAKRRCTTTCSPIALANKLAPHRLGGAG